MRLLALLLVVATGGRAWAADWPMWRCDAARSGYSPDALPHSLNLHWTRQLPLPRPAWPPTQHKLRFDAGPNVVVAGGRVLVPSSATDSVSALDVASGEELWRFYCGGPVRFAPLAAGGRVYFVSDDGHLYCLGAEDGRLLWKVRGGPTQRWVVGNERLISSWAARGGPVLHDGTVYFAASIWPFMGIFIHAVDAKSGAVVWTNSGDGTNHTVQPHGAPAFASVVPQGHLVVAGQRLIVPGGRSVPAVYDLQTGKQIAFHYDKRHGHHQVMGNDDHFFVDGGTYYAPSGTYITDELPALLAPGRLIFAAGNRITALSAAAQQGTKIVKDRRGNDFQVATLSRQRQFDIKTESDVGRALLQAGNRVYTARGDKVLALDVGEDAIARSADQPLSPAWTVQIDGEIWDAVAAADRLFVTTMAGRLYCFGPGQRDPQHHKLDREKLTVATDTDDPWAERARQMLQIEGAAEGYTVVLGLGSGRLVDELLKNSGCHLIVLDESARKVDALRLRMDRAGLYGQRISAKCWQPADAPLPPYLANLIVAEALDEPMTSTFVQRIYRVLRPYGGAACFPTSPEQHEQLQLSVTQANLHGAALSRRGQLSVLVRAGPLAGAGQWTHQYADAGQSGVSQDRLVQAPLGVLWFGGPSNDMILPRHGHGPSPQVAGGRVLIEGPDLLRAMDVYTGRLLWECELRDLGKYYNNTRHFPGAGEIGSNYVSLPDHIYVVYGATIHELDAKTGGKTKEFQLAASPGKPTPNVLV